MRWASDEVSGVGVENGMCRGNGLNKHIVVGGSFAEQLPIVLISWFRFPFVIDCW